MSIKKQKSGIILTETLVSLAMLITATLVLSTIITNAVSTTKLSRDYMLGQNLATEGVEAVKNRRNTNWLLFTDPNDWLYLSAAHSSQVIADTNYITKLENDKWILYEDPFQGDLDLDNYNPAMEAYRLCILNGAYEPGPCTGTESAFYRSMKAISLDPGVSAVFQVKVEWRDGARTRDIIRKFTLHNFI